MRKNPGQTPQQTFRLTASDDANLATVQDSYRLLTKAEAMRMALLLAARAVVNDNKENS